MKQILSVLAVSAALLSTAGAPAHAADPAPPLSVTTVASGLSIPWDLAFLPDGSMLYTQRDAETVTLRTPDGTSRVVLDRPAGMWHQGETGLMGIEVADDFATTRAFLTCHGYKSGSTQDVRIVRWQLNAALTQATKVNTITHGLSSTSGRHAGCALQKGSRNSLYVGTGDSATGKVAQSLVAGGGKVLRIDATSGHAFPGNPWETSGNYMKRRIWTYGHRNVQGLARRSDGTTWSVEQGSYRDDEVNLLTKRGNYGWNPVKRKSGDSAYNEGSDSPMTDYAIPGAQQGAKWRSGDPTVATSGGTFITGPGWGPLDGTLAVAALKDESVRFLQFNAAGTLVQSWKPAELDHQSAYGRIRAAVMGPDGALYLTTSNGAGADKILKVRPATP
jgi:glucose/arabinose dehydrogenase